MCCIRSYYSVEHDYKFLHTVFARHVHRWENWCNSDNQVYSLLGYHSHCQRLYSPNSSVATMAGYYICIHIGEVWYKFAGSLTSGVRLQVTRRWQQCHAGRRGPSAPQSMDSDWSWRSWHPATLWGWCPSSGEGSLAPSHGSGHTRNAIIMVRGLRRSQITQSILLPVHVGLFALLSCVTYHWCILCTVANLEKCCCDLQIAPRTLL